MRERAAVRRALALLSRSERRRLHALAALQTVTPLLDLVAVLLLGLVAVIAAAQAQGATPPAVAPRLLDVLGLAGAPPARTAVGLALAAAVLLVVKSWVSLLIVRRVNAFLVECSARVSAEVSARFLDQPLLHVREQPGQRTAFALTTGLTAAISSLLSAAVGVWSELALLTVLGLALLLVDPVVTVVALGYLLSVSLLMHRLIGGWSARAAALFAESEIGGLTTVHDAIGTYREVAVAGRLGFFRARFAAGRRLAAEARADQNLALAVPRYGMEAALVVGLVLILGVMALTGDPATALGTMALFLAAAMRVMPSLLRLNAQRLTVGTAGEVAASAFELIDALPADPPHPHQAPPAPPPPPDHDHDEIGAVVVDRVTVRYPGSRTPALADVSLRVPAGSSLAIVGPTGSGKSTLADLILGVVSPETGRILLGGRPPREAIRRHPGAVGYVPQDVAVIGGTVRDNVALAIDPLEIDDERIVRALRRVRLADILLGERDGLATVVGDDGIRLSGGQRQRLGLARALYAEPRLLVLDEATSALDAATEQLIAATLSSLGPAVTTITIAHRLSTVRYADQVAYLDRGRLIAVGTFDEVRDAVPQFDEQAQLLGL